MARGDFVDGGKSKFASRNVYSGFSWRYANTSQEAINTNSDVIEIYPYLWKDNTLDTYANDFRNSYVEITVGSTTTTQQIRTKYNFGYASQNTNYYLTTAYSSQNPFGYGVPSSTTNITSMTYGGETIYGARFTIQHNADGTSPTITVKWHLEAYSSHGNANVSTNLVLDTIPRASKPTCNNVTLGQSVTIYTNRVSSSFTHTLNIKIGGVTKETFTNIGESKSWSPAISTYAPSITSSTTGVATIECITYNNGTQLGTATTTCVLTVPDSVEPSCTIAIAKGDNVVPSDWNIWVKGKSKLAITITGTAQYGATIRSYSSSANGSNYSTNSYTTSELTGSGNVTAMVVDSRGYGSSQASTPYTVVDYTNPQITSNSVARCLQDGTISDEGTYIKYSFVGSISEVSNKNAKTFTLKYKEKNGSTWNTIGTWNTYTVNQTSQVAGSGNIDITKEYVFRFEATDTFTTVYKEVEIGTVADLMNFNASGKSMAIGGVSQRGSNEAYLDVYTNAKFYKTIEGNISGNANTANSATSATTATTASKVTTGSRNTTDTWIPVWSNGALDYTTRYIVNSATHSQYNTEQDRLVTLSFMSYWNGAYNSSNNSNLKYCSGGTIAKNEDKGGAMIFLTSNWSFSATAWANTQVAFNSRCTFSASNSNFTQNGNGIKCNFAGWVIVNGVVATDKTNEFDATILKGSTQIIRPINSGGRQSVVNAVFQVANGDTVYLGFASGNTSGTIYNQTHFTIMRIS